MSQPELSDADLSACADGQLAPGRAVAVEAALAADPALAAKVAAIRAQNAALRAALEPVLAEEIPQRLLDAARPPGAETGWRSGPARWRLPALAAAASLVLGVALGWTVRDAVIERSGTPTTFAREAAFTHALYTADQRRPVEVWAAEEKGLVTWLTKRLGFAVTAPNLNDVGFALVGGRLVAGNEKPTGLFMYENADKQRLTLQVRKQGSDAGETSFRYAVENGVGVFYWIDDGCGYALTGSVDRAQLLAVARVVYGQLAAAEVRK